MEIITDELYMRIESTAKEIGQVGLFRDGMESSASERASSLYSSSSGAPGPHTLLYTRSHNIFLSLIIMSTPIPFLPFLLISSTINPFSFLAPFLFAFCFSTNDFFVYVCVSFLIFTHTPQLHHHILWLL